MNTGDLNAVLAALFWSFSVIFMRVAGFQIPPLPLTFFKNWVAILCFGIAVPIVGAPLWPSLEAMDWVRLVLSAVLGISIADTVFAAALNRLGASLQALADCIYSPTMALVGLLMFGEWLGLWEIIGGLLVLTGVLVGAGITTGFRGNRQLSQGLFLAATAHVVMAFGILMVRDLIREESLVWISGVRFFVATVVLWGFSFTPWSRGQDLYLGFRRRETWKLLIPMAVLGPFLATLCWVAGFKYLTAGRAAIYNQVSTVFITLLAFLLLKEKMTKRTVTGVCLAMAGSLLVALYSPGESVNLDDAVERSEIIGTPPGATGVGRPDAVDDELVLVLPPWQGNRSSENTFVGIFEGAGIGLPVVEGADEGDAASGRGFDFEKDLFGSLFFRNVFSSWHGPGGG
ncbi:MAG: DMT family transporter [Verrucomicrobiota bacterium]